MPASAYLEICTHRASACRSLLSPPLTIVDKHRLGAHLSRYYHHHHHHYCHTPSRPPLPCPFPQKIACWLCYLRYSLLLHPHPRAYFYSCNTKKKQNATLRWANSGSGLTLNTNEYLDAFWIVLFCRVSPSCTISHLSPATARDRKQPASRSIHRM